MPQEQISLHFPPYLPDQNERNLLIKIYSDFSKNKILKESSHPILSNRTLQTFFDDSNKSYAQFTQDSDSNDDWMREYPAGITRDRTNTFISNLCQKMIVPQIFAQNTMQIVDRIVSRILKILLGWAIKNDGKPTDSGHSKFVKAVHKCVIEGTMHRLLSINEDKEHETFIIPNEEIYIPTFWQTDIQKLPHFLWVQNNVTYEEAKEEFGDLENFKKVIPGKISDWMAEEPFLKNYSGTIVEDKRVQIIRGWYPVPKDQLPKGRRRQKYYNVAINGVLMFSYDNRDIYRHGYYPISKWIFEFLDTHFYWGNSLPNKMRHDQKWATAYRTIIMNKGKLAMLPPMFAEDGLNVDAEVYVPAKITSITGKAEQLKNVPGITPISAGEVTLLDVIQKSGDEASASPVTAGMPSREQRTLGEVQLQESNATRLISLFGLMFAFGVEQESWLVLKNIIQFYPRKKINELAKISIPNQTLSSNRVGTMEIIFKNVMDMNEDERLRLANDIKLEEMKTAKMGEPKEITYIDPSYAEKLELFIEMNANPVERQSRAMSRYLALATYRELYQNNPLINQELALRRTLRGMEEDGAEEELVIEQNPQLPQGMGEEMMEAGSVADKRFLPHTSVPAEMRTGMGLEKSAF